MRVSLFLSFFFLSSIIALSHDKLHRNLHLAKKKRDSKKFLKASFTFYSGCNSPTACGMYGNKNTAAINENYYGVGPGEGTGPGCGRCWLLRNFTSTEGKDLIHPQTKQVIHAKPLVVYIDNECPRGGNEICGQTPEHPLNSYDAPVHFDLCQDNGTPQNIVGDSGIGLFLGQAQLLNNCQEWLAQGGVVSNKPWNQPKTLAPYNDANMMY